MSITALEIQEVRFGEAKKGYDPNEVDEFLERVAADVDTLNRALTEAAARIKTAEKRADETERKLAQTQTQLQAATERAAAVPPVAMVAPVVKERDEPKEPDVTGEAIAKAFIAAQKSADALQEEARKEAEKVYREAEAKGRDIVRDSLAEKQKTLEELARLRESSEKFRTEYLSLLKYFQQDAQKRLTVFDDAIDAQQVADSAPALAGGAGAAGAGAVGGYGAASGAGVAAGAVAAAGEYGAAGGYGAASAAGAAAAAPAASDPFAAPAGAAAVAYEAPPVSLADPFAEPPAYQMSFDDEDLDIEEID